GQDSAKADDGTTSPNIEGQSPNPLFSVGQNEKIFKVDKGAPTAIIQKPSTASIFTMAPISGTADDANSGVQQVDVAFYGVSEANWWNPATAGTFNLGGANSVPPSNAFIKVSSDNASPVNWYVAAASIPVVVDNQHYRIFVRVTDNVGNQNAFPG